MSKIDFKKQYKQLYSVSSKEVSLVEVPRLQFLMVDGAGDPNEVARFREAVEALFSVSYTLKFMAKKAPLALDYVVPPLEGLWWADDLQAFDVDRMDKNAWKWTLMIPQPEQVPRELALDAIEHAARKKPLPAAPDLRLETYEEGLSAQILHMGPYAEEAPTIEKMHRTIRERGFELCGKHHEIYLSDPGRAQPEKLKTILRQPVRKV